MLMESWRTFIRHVIFLVVLVKYLFQGFKEGVGERSIALVFVPVLDWPFPKFIITYDSFVVVIGLIVLADFHKGQTERQPQYIQSLYTGVCGWIPQFGYGGMINSPDPLSARKVWWHVAFQSLISSEGVVWNQSKNCWNEIPDTPVKMSLN